MPVVERNGLRFHVQELGHGPPVVLVHGIFPDTLSSWYFTVAPHLARRRRLLLFDLRGHGRSERPPSGYGLRSMAADLAAVVDGFAQEPVSVAGFSFGAAIALRYAVDHPVRIDRLALVEAPLPVMLAEEVAWIVAQDRSRLVELLPEPKRAALRQDGRRRARLRADARELRQETTMLADVLADSDVEDEALARLTRPVLLCYATRSRLEKTARRLERGLPRAEVVRIDGSHFLPIDAPAALTSAIERFLDG